MDFTVFSHLRWNFVFQRPQHLMTRCSASSRVFFWEEPIFGAPAAFLDVREVTSTLRVVVPHIPAGLAEEEVQKIQKYLLRDLRSRYAIKDHSVLWYYTPLALHFSRDIAADAVVYDCMDELTAFRGAPAGLRAAETELFDRADLVFTGGKSLYESKKWQHSSVHCFPSSIDLAFFSSARSLRSEAPDQARIPHPRLGYCGVIDERLDLDLLAGIADARPEWQLVLLGPVAKIAESDLPRRTNIHYLGQKDYKALPSYFAGWDVGLLPFALNEATRFISPTKTPEYLAAGLPAVSTPIADVVDPYGRKNLVHIAQTTDEFVRAAEKAITSRNASERLARVDEHLSDMSWDSTWERMYELISQALHHSTLGLDQVAEDPIIAGNGELQCSTI